MHRHDKIDYDALKTQYDQFMGGIKAIGKAAQDRAAAQQKADLAKKEQADAENARTHAADAVTIASLRRQRDSARGSNVPAAAPGSSRPDLACFDRAALESALGGLLAEIRGLADEGTAATVDLNTAREWAKKGP